ncbi:hypothetical protein HK105_207672 [Polyrhizophydium stewartii]|uniref:Uncharacterized protein n=1 Tax=Polyrhizophydium stewartii TaxID=2732419 RepID=A0ABR4MZU6_9FUNG
MDRVRLLVKAQIGPESAGSGPESADELGGESDEPLDAIDEELVAFRSDLSPAAGSGPESAGSGPESADELGGESDEPLDAIDEELVAFRSDLSPHVYADGAYNDAASDALSDAASDPDAPSGGHARQCRLDAEFGRALSASTMLVEYQEQLIMRRLASVREMGSVAAASAATQHDIAAVLSDALRHHASQLAPLAAAKHAPSVAAPAPQIRPAQPLEAVRISDRSRAFARFIPTLTPQFALSPALDAQVSE